MERARRESVEREVALHLSSHTRLVPVLPGHALADPRGWNSVHQHKEGQACLLWGLSACRLPFFSSLAPGAPPAPGRDCRTPHPPLSAAIAPPLRLPALPARPPTAPDWARPWRAAGAGAPRAGAGGCDRGDEPGLTTVAREAGQPPALAPGAGAGPGPGPMQAPPLGWVLGGPSSKKVKDAYALGQVRP